MVSRTELVQTLDAVKPGVSKKEAIQQSSCFVFKDGWVHSFNMDLACRAPCDLGFEFTGAVDAESMLTLLNKMPDDDLAISYDDGELRIKGRGRKAGLRVDEQITLPIDSVEPADEWFPIEDEFFEAIRLASPCANTNEEHFDTTCLNITPQFIEATDNKQYFRYPFETPIAKPCLVRNDAIKHVVGMGFTRMAMSRTWLHFRNAVKMRMSVRRQIGKFPDGTRVLDFTGTPTTLPSGMAEAIDTAKAFSDDDDVMVILENDRMKIVGIGAMGWFSETQRVSYKGEKISFLINAKILKELGENHSNCDVGEGRLKVNAGRFTYVTCLGMVQDG